MFANATFTQSSHMHYPRITHLAHCLYTAKTLVLNMQHQAGVKLAVLIFGVGLTPLGVNTKSKTARFGTFL